MSTTNKPPAVKRVKNNDSTNATAFFERQVRSHKIDVHTAKSETGSIEFVWTFARNAEANRRKRISLLVTAIKVRKRKWLRMGDRSSCVRMSREEQGECVKVT